MPPDYQSSGAGTELEQGESGPSTQDSGSGDEETYFISGDDLPDNLSPGDTLTVVGKDADGRVEVKCEHGKGESKPDSGDMGDDLEKHMNG